MATVARPWDGDDTRRRITAWIDHFDSLNDGRGIFLEMYVAASDHVAAAGHDGTFSDPRWVAQVAEHVADYYFLTVEPDTADPQSLPKAWTAAHHVAACEDVVRTEALLLGLNAHINSDLPHAVYEVLLREWPVARPLLDQRRRDVFSLVDVFSEAANARGPMRRIVASWRPEVWENALSLLTAVDRPWRRGIVESIECTASRRAHLIVCDIPGRTDLLQMRAHELQRSFPLHHDAAACKLGTAPPLWGAVTVA